MYYLDFELRLKIPTFISFLKFGQVVYYKLIYTPKVDGVRVTPHYHHNSNIMDTMFEQKNELLSNFLDNLYTEMLGCNVKNTDSITADLIDLQFAQDIQKLPSNIRLEFGETLRDIKCSIADSESLRQHYIFVKYVAPRKLLIDSVALPYTSLQQREYSSIEEIINTFKAYIDSLSNYFYELESIDCNFTVMEPVNPSFKDDFRRIFLDERTWLHLEVTQQGLATNIYLIGQCDIWQDKLQKGLLSWDHDKSIVDNIMGTFDLSNLSLLDKHVHVDKEKQPNVEEIICGICFSVELPDIPGVPQPLCQNSNCGVYFHKYCLFQWLVACEGGRPPAFGVANGNCPTCLQPIACSEKDNSSKICIQY